MRPGEIIPQRRRDAEKKSENRCQKISAPLRDLIREKAIIPLRREDAEHMNLYPKNLRASAPLRESIRCRDAEKMNGNANNLSASAPADAPCNKEHRRRSLPPRHFRAHQAPEFQILTSLCSMPYPCPPTHPQNYSPA